MLPYQPKTSLRNLPQLLKEVSVLVFDPDTRIANIVKHVLLNLGFSKVMVMNTYAEAQLAVETHPIDFIIADFDLDTGEQEKSFAEYVRHSDTVQNPQVPIIMLTGHTNIAHVEIARDMGITEFSAKPFTAKSLCDRIVKVIENPRSFIITKRYKGPDRRRRQSKEYTGENRREREDMAASPATGAPKKKRITRDFFERVTGKKFNTEGNP